MGLRTQASIGNKLLAVLVAVAILPAVTVSIYALRKTTEALADQALSLIIHSTESQTQRISDFLDQVNEDLQSLTELERLREYCEKITPLSGTPPISEEEFAAGSAWLQQKLRTFLEQRPSGKTLVLLSQKSISTIAATVRADRNNRSVQPRTALSMQDDGSVVWSGQIEQPLDTVFRRALQKTVLEHPFRTSHRVTVDAGERGAFEVFLVEIQDDSRRRTGRLLFALSWKRVLQELASDLIDRSGDGSAVEVALLDRRLRPLASAGVAPSFVIPAEMRVPASSGKTGAILETAGSIVAYAPLRTLGDDNFSVLSFRHPTTPEFERVSSFRYVFSAVLAGALVLALGLGTFVARRLTKPLRVLRDGARKIGAGKLDHTLSVGTGDEAEELAAEFNSMASQLRTLYDDMEHTIQERTKQLREALNELKEAHEGIVESEARYSDIVENASDLIQITDQEGRIRSANRREAEVLETNAEELIGSDFFEWVAPDLRESTRRAFQSVLDGANLSSYPSALLVGESNRRVPIEISATPVVLNGRCEGARAIIRDVSERKATEAQLIKAERLSSVGALAAGVAHEINNPLGIITMFAQRTLEKAQQGHVDVDKLEKIVDQARRVAGITKGLLDFSRSAPTEFESFDLGKVVEDTAGLIRERTRRQNTELSIEVAAHLPSVQGNAQQIGQVVLNLLLNAAHSLNSGGKIHVRAEHLDVGNLAGGGPSLRVQVEDTGPGIPADVLPHLFEPFFTTKAPGEGTGLGLSVSYGILKEHRGVLSASNAPHGGARFEFELPVADGP